MEMNGQLHALGPIPPGGRYVGTHWIGRWVGPRAGLDAVAKRKNLAPCRESNLGHPSRSLVTVLTELLRFNSSSSSSSEWFDRCLLHIEALTQFM
jgi:hypothetical protein